MKPIIIFISALFFVTVGYNFASALDFVGFDPVGDVLEPFKEIVPDLEIHGFFKNRTDLDLHGGELSFFIPLMIIFPLRMLPNQRQLSRETG